MMLPEMIEGKEEEDDPTVMLPRIALPDIPELSFDGYYILAPDAQGMLTVYNLFAVCNCHEELPDRVMSAWLSGVIARLHLHRHDAIRCALQVHLDTGWRWTGIEKQYIISQLSQRLGLRFRPWFASRSEAEQAAEAANALASCVVERLCEQEEEAHGV